MAQGIEPEIFDFAPDTLTPFQGDAEVFEFSPDELTPFEDDQAEVFDFSPDELTPFQELPRPDRFSIGAKTDYESEDDYFADIQTKSKLFDEEEGFMSGLASGWQTYLASRDFSHTTNLSNELAQIQKEIREQFTSQQGPLAPEDSDHPGRAAPEGELQKLVREESVSKVKEREGRVIELLRESTKRIDERLKEAFSRSQHPLLQAFMQAETDAERWKVFKMDPEAITREVIAMSLPYMIEMYGMSILGGLAGGPAGATAGTFGGSFFVERRAEGLQALSEQGVDVSNPEEVFRLASENPEAFNAAMETGALKALGVASGDALAMMVANRIFKNVPGLGAADSIKTALRILGKNGLRSAVMMPVEGITAMAGEAGGQMLAHGEVDKSEMYLEGLGEVVQGPITGAVAQIAKSPVTAFSISKNVKAERIKRDVEMWAASEGIKFGDGENTMSEIAENLKRRADEQVERVQKEAAETDKIVEEAMSGKTEHKPVATSEFDAVSEGDDLTVNFGEDDAEVAVRVTKANDTRVIGEALHDMEGEGFVISKGDPVVVDRTTGRATVPNAEDLSGFVTFVTPNAPEGVTATAETLATEYPTYAPTTSVNATLVPKADDLDIVSDEEMNEAWDAMMDNTASIDDYAEAAKKNDLYQNTLDQALDESLGQNDRMLVYPVDEEPDAKHMLVSTEPQEEGQQGIIISRSRVVAHGAAEGGGIDLVVEKLPEGEAEAAPKKAEAAKAKKPAAEKAKAKPAEKPSEEVSEATEEAAAASEKKAKTERAKPTAEEAKFEKVGKEPGKEVYRNKAGWEIRRRSRVWDVYDPEGNLYDTAAKLTEARQSIEEVLAQGSLPKKGALNKAYLEGRNKELDAANLKWAKKFLLGLTTKSGAPAGRVVVVLDVDDLKKHKSGGQTIYDRYIAKDEEKMRWTNGLYDRVGRKAYFVVNNIHANNKINRIVDNPTQRAHRDKVFRELWAHEVGTHMGLRSLAAKRATGQKSEEQILREILTEVYDENSSTISQWVKASPYKELFWKGDGVDPKHILDATEEWIANVKAEKYATTPWWKKLVAWIKRNLFQIGAGKWDDAEIHALLRHAKASLPYDPSTKAGQWDTLKLNDPRPTDKIDNMIATVEVGSEKVESQVQAYNLHFGPLGQRLSDEYWQMFTDTFSGSLKPMSSLMNAVYGREFKLVSSIERDGHSEFAGGSYLGKVSPNLRLTLPEDMTDVQAEAWLAAIGVAFSQEAMAASHFLHHKGGIATPPPEHHYRTIVATIPTEESITVREWQLFADGLTRDNSMSYARTADKKGYQVTIIPDMYNANEDERTAPVMTIEEVRSALLIFRDKLSPGGDFHLTYADFGGYYVTDNTYPEKIAAWKEAAIEDEFQKIRRRKASDREVISGDTPWRSVPDRDRKRLEKHARALQERLDGFADALDGLKREARRLDVRAQQFVREGKDRIERAKAEEDFSLDLVHWSNHPHLTETDPRYYGSMGAGAEMQRKLMDPANWVDRTYFGVDGYKKESVTGDHPYRANVLSYHIYDFNTDPDGIRKHMRAFVKEYNDKHKKEGKEANTVNVYEKLIKEAGYRGYRAGKVVAIFDNVKVEPGVLASLGSRMTEADAAGFSDRVYGLDAETAENGIITVSAKEWSEPTPYMRHGRVLDSMGLWEAVREGMDVTTYFPEAKNETVRRMTPAQLARWFERRFDDRVRRDDKPAVRILTDSVHPPLPVAEIKKRGRAWFVSKGYDASHTEDGGMAVFGWSQVERIDSSGLFSLPDNAKPLTDVFFSQMQKHLEEFLPNKGTGKSYLEFIRKHAKLGKFKEEELEWSGLVEELEAVGDGKMSKDDVLRLMPGIEVYEVVRDGLGEDSIDIDYGNWETDEPDPYAIREQAEEHYFDDVMEEMVEEEFRDGITDFLEDYAEELGKGYNELTAAERTRGQEEYREELMNNNRLKERAMDEAVERAESDYYSDSDSPATRIIVANIGGDRHYFDHSDSYGDSYLYSHDGTELNIPNRADDAEIESAIREFLGAQSEGLGGKWAEYTVEGGENYREFLLVFDKPGADYFIESAHFNEENIIVFVRVKDRVVDGKQVLFIEEMQSDWHQNARDAVKSMARALARNEGIPYKEAIKRIPSDIGYKGRAPVFKELPPGWTVERGYNPHTGRDDAFVVRDHKGNSITIGSARETREEVIATAIRIANREHPVASSMSDPFATVPDAPFKQTIKASSGNLSGWAGLAFKRMIHLAATEGYDKIAWTPGSVHNERWGFVNKIDNIAVGQRAKAGVAVRVESGRGRVDLGRVDESVTPLTTADKEYAPLGVEPHQMSTFGWFIVPEDRIPAIFGDEMADKIFARAEAGGGQIAGEDLKVGGKGMTGFYDMMLVNEVGKFLKKFGGEVKSEPIMDIQAGFGAVVVDFGLATGEEWNDATQDQRAEWMKVASEMKSRAWSVDITEEMRPELSKQLPLYSIPQQDSDAFKKWSRGYPVVNDASPAGGFAFETGKPVVVRAYHGTRATTIEQYDNSYLGRNTEAGSAKLAHFFSGKSETAGDPSYVGYRVFNEDHSLPFLDITREERDAIYSEAENIFGGLVYEAMSADNTYHVWHVDADGPITAAGPYFYRVGAEANLSNQIRDLLTMDAGFFAYMYEQAMGRPYAWPAPTMHREYIRLTNPFVIDYNNSHYREPGFRVALEQAYQAGHDGVIFMNVFDGGRRDNFDNIFAVFNEEAGQIKSSIGNNGNYDDSSPHILASLPPDETDETQEGKGTEGADKTRGRKGAERDRQTIPPTGQDAGGRADVVFGGKLKGDGRGFTKFFDEVSRGIAGTSSTGAPFVPVTTAVAKELGREASRISRFAVEYAKHRGNFDDHIAFSIPGHREVQIATGAALVNLYRRGGKVLDIGASEGSWIKSITARSKGKIETVGVDPNPGMHKHFTEKSDVKGSRYLMEAFGESSDRGKLAWTETDGTKIRFMSVNDGEFDVVHESMVFQFISNARNAQVRRVKELLKKNGLALFEQKVFTTDVDRFNAREDKKDYEYKIRYFSEEEIEAKRQAILRGAGDEVEGMNDLMVFQGELEQAILKNFRWTALYWSSGNFVGYAASDSLFVLNDFFENLVDTNSEYSDQSVGEYIQSKEITPEKMDAFIEKRFPPTLPREERQKKFQAWADDVYQKWYDSYSNLVDEPDRAFERVRLDFGKTLDDLRARARSDSEEDLAAAARHVMTNYTNVLHALETEIFTSLINRGIPEAEANYLAVKATKDRRSGIHAAAFAGVRGRMRGQVLASLPSLPPDLDPQARAIIDAKIGFGSSSLLTRVFSPIRNYRKGAATQRVFDKFHSLKRLDLMAYNQTVDEIEARVSSYINARMTTGLSSIMESIMLHGTPRWLPSGGFMSRTHNKGLLWVFEGAGPETNAILAWMAGERAYQLHLEGREKLFTLTEIQKLRSLRQRNPQLYDRVKKRYIQFKKEILDFAEEAGVINAQTRPTWDSDDYIPFYRIMEEQQAHRRGEKSMLKGVKSAMGIANQPKVIRRLRGGTQNLGDLMTNIVMNFSMLVDGAVKNHAAQIAVDAGQRVTIDPNTGEKIIQELGYKDYRGHMERVAASAAATSLRKIGVNVDRMTQAQRQSVIEVFKLLPPQEKGVIHVLKNGKPVYYRVNDELLYQSLTSLHQEGMGPIIGFMAQVKRFKTRMITANPEFWLRNMIRDTVHAWIVAKDTGGGPLKPGFVPVYDSLKGFANQLRSTDPVMVALMSQGAAFVGGWTYGSDPEGAKVWINRMMRSHGLTKGHLGFMTAYPRKMLELWDRVGGRFENAARREIYVRQMKAHGNHLRAAYESKDIMDFSLHGDAQLVRFFIHTTAFLGARMQGLYRAARALKSKSPAARRRGMAKLAVMSLGVSLRIATYSLLTAWMWLKIMDDDDLREQYENETDHNRDMYHYLPMRWPNGELVRFPKPFEAGLLIGTSTERMLEYMRNGEDGHALAKSLKFGLAETLSMNWPTLIEPVIELERNRSYFTDREIVPYYMQGGNRRMEARPWTSEAAKVVAQMTPYAGDSFMSWINSPMALEHMVYAYTGTMGKIAMDFTDSAVRGILDMPDPPKKRFDQMWVVKSFAAGKDKPFSKQTDQLYEAISAARGVMRTVSNANKDPFFEDQANEWQQVAQRTGAASIVKLDKQLAQWRKEYADIYMDRNLTASQKRDRLAVLDRQRQRFAESVNKQAVEFMQALREQTRGLR